MTRPIDRRAARRHYEGEHCIVGVRIRPGYSARVIDVSMDGTLIETHFRLMPGSIVELHMATEHQHISIRGQVVRCSVARLRPAVCYRGAIAFDERLPWFGGGDGYRVPASDSHRDRLAREGTTREPL